MSLSCSDSLSALLTSVSPVFLETSFVEGVPFADAPTLPLGDDSSLTAFFNSSSFCFFFSCLLRSSAFVELVNAIVLPSGAHFGLLAPFGNSVNTNESPPVIGKIDNCGGSSLPSFSVARTNKTNFPSGDQRGAPS